MSPLLQDIRTQGLRMALLGGTTLRHAGRLEGFFLRLLFAIVVYISLKSYPAYQTLLKPVGIAAWPGLWHWLGWDLTRLADPVFWELCLRWAYLALGFYVIGFGLPLALPVITLIHIAIRTLNNSQGAPHHGFQMVSLALLCQTLVVWFLAAVRTRALLGKRPLPSWAASGNWTWLWIYTVAVIAATYVTSVCTKLDKSGGQWLLNSPHVAGQIVKTHRQNYYSALDPRFIQGLPPAAHPVPDPSTDRYRHPIPAQADWLARHPALARVIFGAGFFLEFLAFLAVFDRRAALVIGLGLVSLHGSIGWLMELTFPLNERTVGVFHVNAAGWLILMIKDPAWRPTWKIITVSFLTAAALLVAHLATATADTLAAHFLDLTQHPASLIPDLFDWPAALKWPWVLVTQTVLLSALILIGKSVRPKRSPEPPGISREPA